MAHKKLPLFTRFAPEIYFVIMAASLLPIFSRTVKAFVTNVPADVTTSVVALMGLAVVFGAMTVQASEVRARRLTR